jgi:hypothetical protein
LLFFLFSSLLFSSLFSPLSPLPHLVPKLLALGEMGEEMAEKIREEINILYKPMKHRLA